MRACEQIGVVFDHDMNMIELSTDVTFVWLRVRVKKVLVAAVCEFENPVHWRGFWCVCVCVKRACLLYTWRDMVVYVVTIVLGDV